MDNGGGGVCGSFCFAGFFLFGAGAGVPSCALIVPTLERVVEGGERDVLHGIKTSWRGNVSKDNLFYPETAEYTEKKI